MTQNIRKRLNQHNSGHGSLSTISEELRPFALITFINGFGEDGDLCKKFESEWQQNIFWQGQWKGNLSLQDKITYGKQLMISWIKEKEMIELVFVECVRINKSIS